MIKFIFVLFFEILNFSNSKLPILKIKNRETEISCGSEKNFFNLYQNTQIPRSEINFVQIVGGNIMKNIFLLIIFKQCVHFIWSYKAEMNGFPDKESYLNLRLCRLRCTYILNRNILYFGCTLLTWNKRSQF